MALPYEYRVDSQGQPWSEYRIQRLKEQDRRRAAETAAQRRPPVAQPRQNPFDKEITSTRHLLAPPIAPLSEVAPRQSAPEEFRMPPPVANPDLVGDIAPEAWFKRSDKSWRTGSAAAGIDPTPPTKFNQFIDKLKRGPLSFPRNRIEPGNTAPKNVDVDSALANLRQQQSSHIGGIIPRKNIPLKQGKENPNASSVWGYGAAPVPKGPIRAAVPRTRTKREAPQETENWRMNRFRQNYNIEEPTPAPARAKRNAPAAATLNMRDVPNDTPEAAFASTFRPRAKAYTEIDGGVRRRPGRRFERDTLPADVLNKPPPTKRARTDRYRPDAQPEFTFDADGQPRPTTNSPFNATREPFSRPLVEGPSRWSRFKSAVSSKVPKISRPKRRNYGTLENLNWDVEPQPNADVLARQRRGARVDTIPETNRSIVRPPPNTSRPAGFINPPATPGVPPTQSYSRLQQILGKFKPRSRAPPPAPSTDTGPGSLDRIMQAFRSPRVAPAPQSTSRRTRSTFEEPRQELEWDTSADFPRDTTAKPTLKNPASFEDATTSRAIYSRGAPAITAGPSTSATTPLASIKNTPARSKKSAATRGSVVRSSGPSVLDTVSAGGSQKTKSKKGRKTAGKVAVGLTLSANVGRHMGRTAGYVDNANEESENQTVTTGQEYSSYPSSSSNISAFKAN